FPTADSDTNTDTITHEKHCSVRSSYLSKPRVMSSPAGYSQTVRAGKTCMIYSLPVAIASLIYSRLEVHLLQVNSRNQESIRAPYWFLLAVKPLTILPERPLLQQILQSQDHKMVHQLD
uniref:Uncharacterized protein n=1 Tax=Seriola dumerili TaxID=41447 RepID=A0A3B4TQ15_SERDU